MPDDLNPVAECRRYVITPHGNSMNPDGYYVALRSKDITVGSIGRPFPVGNWELTSYSQTRWTLECLNMVTAFLLRLHNGEHP